MTKFVLDTDPGWDDALVLVLLLAKPDIDLLSITTAWGNEDVQWTTTNARRMTHYLGRDDIPIYVGATAGLTPTSVALPCPPSNVVASLPFDGTAVVRGPYAPDMLAKMARTHGSDLTILGIASMTNLAGAVQADRAAMRSVHLVITGGSFCKDKQTHEFNLGCDAVATRMLLEADLNPVIITFDTETTMNRGKEAQQKMRDAGAKNKYATFYADVIQDQLNQNNLESNQGVFDQLAALYALDPSVFTLEQTKIVLHDDPTGWIERDSSGARAQIATVKVDEAYNLLFSRLGVG
jgi:purine nucleosidase